MQRLHGLIALGFCLVSATAQAEEPEQLPATTLVQASLAVKNAPSLLPTMLRTVEDAVVSRLEMVIFSDRSTGEEAKLRLTPATSPGAKVGFTYRF